MKWYFVSILFFCSPSLFAQLQNSHIRLDSIQYVDCRFNEDECYIDRVTIYEHSGDTIISRKNMLVSQKGMQFKEEFHYVFDQEGRRLYSLYGTNRSKNQQEWHFENDLMLRRTEKSIVNSKLSYYNEYKYYYNGDLLERIEYQRDSGKISSSKLLHDDQGRIIYYGQNYDEGKKSLGSHYTYSSDQDRLPNSYMTIYPNDLSSTVYRATYNDNGNLDQMSHGIIYHNENNKEQVLTESSFKYDDAGFLTQNVTLRENSKSTINYFYDSTGNLTETFEIDMKEGEIIEERKMTFEYLDENGMEANAMLITGLSENVISNLNYYSMRIDMDPYHLGIFPDQKSNLKQLPLKITSTKRNKYIKEWMYPSSYKFYYSTVER